MRHGRARFTLSILGVVTTELPLQQIVMEGDGFDLPIFKDAFMGPFLDDAFDAEAYVRR